MATALALGAAVHGHAVSATVGGVRISVCPGPADADWAARLAQVCTAAEALGTPEPIDLQFLLRLDGWRWDAVGLRLPAWLATDTVPWAAVEAVAPGLRQAVAP
jgi:hypothetical protein